MSPTWKDNSWRESMRIFFFQKKKTSCGQWDQGMLGREEEERARSLFIHSHPFWFEWNTVYVILKCELCVS